MKLTEAAIVKISQLIQDTKISMPEHDIFLRIAVQPGGCSGLKYQIYFDYQKNLKDEIFRYEQFDIRVDNLSHPYLIGATMDYNDTIDKQGFSLDNPNAVGTCACGDSFN